MWRSECLLALLVLAVSTAHSWDIAITKKDQILFYTNQNLTSNVETHIRELTALAYDAVHNMLLFVDKKNDNASIFSYSLETKKYQALVRKQSIEEIQGVAFDAITSTLFWTDRQERSIFSLSMKPGATNEGYGKRIIQLGDELPRAIAVDSCRGYIYWTNINTTRPTIERALLDGTKRQVVIDTEIYLPMGIAIDQRTKKLYWVDDKKGHHYSLESSDLEGKNRHPSLNGTLQEPIALTVSKDYIYWIDFYRKIFRLPKNFSNQTPAEFISFDDDTPIGIVANYQIEDQTEGVPDCEALRSLSKNKSAINNLSTDNIPKNEGLFCVHGKWDDRKSECICADGYSGPRCDKLVCQNWCVHGECIITKGEPTCRCNDSFTGNRCETRICYDDYCLNGGRCTVSQEKKPECLCGSDFEGSRCQHGKVLTTPAAPTIIVTEPSNCTQGASLMPSEHVSPTDGEFVIPNSNDGWDSIRDPIIMVLGILCGMLCLICAVLITKILQLKKRPRIKKRFVVNKNVTPMTARPDQCEITIENCCNMNICETPCFEPRTTIRPSLLDAKPGKEEKKNLITNMEYPDDY